ncbi:alpha/beta fold hydrolase [Actinomycetospora aeridis]|uniref:Alpha/beta hydrolase n=1 Tax=Actinomycetospora aeridis TaxID=3129231 RepID=A0ABU8N1J3_9PSEU
METFVLITGAWHGGWSWRPVATRLRAEGHRVLAPTLPGLGIDDDPRGVTLTDAVDAVVGLVETEELRDVTLVAHSWGGFVACGAAPVIAPQLKRTVFWSAFVPEDGESLMDAVPPPYRELFTGLAAASTDDTITMPFEVWSSAFIQDGTPEVQQITHAQMAPQPFATFTEAANQKPFLALDTPTAYIRTTDDIALPPGEWGWDRFATRLADPTIVETPGSHEANFTRPAELTEAILRVSR